MDTKALLEGALLVGINVIMTLFGLMFPLLGNFLLLLTPLPFIVLAVRWNSQLTILASIVSTLLLMILLGPEIFLFTLFFSGLIGVALGAAFEEGFSPVIVLLIGTLAVLVSFGLNLLVSTYILQIDVVGELVTSFEESSNLYQQLGFSSEVVNPVIDELISLIKNTYLILFLCAGMIIASINYYFSVKLLTKIGDFNYPTLSFLNQFKLPRMVVIIYLLSLFLGGIIWQNINILLTFLLTVEGGLVVYDYYLRDQINKLVLILGIIFFPVAVQILLFVGVADVWFDFRDLKSNSEQ